MRLPMLPVLLSLLVACTGKDKDETPEKDPLLSVDNARDWTLPGLSKDAYVIYGEMGVPHVYAHDQGDLGRVLGFTVARDRFFYMDLARRLTLGQISGLLGDAGLETDIESRSTGMTYVADHLLALVDEDPELAAYFDGFADGVNAYVTAVQAGELPPPSEFVLAATLLGKDSATELLAPFDRRSVAAGVVTILYESGFETKDVGRTRDAAALDGVFDGAPLEALREAGLFGDIWNNAAPPNAIASAPGWLAANPPARPPARNGRGVHVEPAALERLIRRNQRIEDRFGHDWVSGFGSNAWAVDAAHSADGRAMMAADGHLQLSIPPILYGVGLDTSHLGDGDIHQVGTLTPALPMLATGTNGEVAFGQTQLMGDITDWYREVLVVDEDGKIVGTRFKGEDKDLVAIEETIDVTPVPPPLGGGISGPYTFTRYTTFDGRWLSTVEGDDVGGYDDEVEDPRAVLMSGRWVVPRDVDADGDITAVSFDYTGFDVSNMARVIDQYTRADDVDAFAEASRNLSSHSLNLVAADSAGNIFYTGFEAIPCRTYLDRQEDGDWVEGADPNLLIDGTKYGGFTIPLTADGMLDNSQSSDPYKCIVPWDEYPHEKNPDQGFLITANNDPGGFSLDGSLTNDEWYIGGPWIEGYRAVQIELGLQDAIADGGVSVDDMKAVQGDHRSTIGRQLVPVLLAALDVGDAAASGSPAADTPDARMKLLVEDNRDRFDMVRARITAWQARDLVAESGVVTFYEPVVTEDQRADAVATSIFNAWMGRFTRNVVDDEGIPGLGWPTGDTGKFRVLRMALEGRGADNPLDLDAWNPDTEEPVWCDIRSTTEVETCDESALLALVTALDYLASEETDPGEGGFGSADMDTWLWGNRHLALMTSLLGDFLGDGDPLIAQFTAPFNITPEVFVNNGTILASDPLAQLPGFPRPGDHLGIDALNSGTGGERFSSGSGSVNRTVVALGGKGFEAYNVIPGGQSGLTDSPNFADQAALWLGNQYLPMYLEVADVVEHAERRETFKAE